MLRIFGNLDIYLLVQILIVIRKIMIMMNGRGFDGEGNENDEA